MRGENSLIKVPAVYDFLFFSPLPSNDELLCRMTPITPYLYKHTLRELVVDPSVEDVRLSSSDNHLVLDVFFKPGFWLERAQLLFDPFLSCLKVELQGEVYLLHRSAVEADDPTCVEKIEGAINQMISMVRGGAGGKSDKAVSDVALRVVEGICIGRDFIEKLARNALVTDFVCGRSASECLLQFQIRSNGWFDVCEAAPMDWVGIEFTAKYADLSWFDRMERFRSRRFVLGDPDLERFLDDPVGSLPRIDRVVKSPNAHVPHPVRRLLDELRLSLDDAPMGPRN